MITPRRRLSLTSTLQFRQSMNNRSRSITLNPTLFILLEGAVSVTFLALAPVLAVLHLPFDPRGEVVQGTFNMDLPPVLMLRTKKNGSFMLKRHTRLPEVPIQTRLIMISIVTSTWCLQGVAGLVTFAPAPRRATQMDGLLPVILRRNTESQLCGARCPIPPALALGMLGHGKNDSCLSVAALSPISLPRHHPQFLTPRGGAHILLTSHHHEGMRAISLIPHILVRHLEIVGALAPFQLY